MFGEPAEQLLPGKVATKLTSNKRTKMSLANAEVDKTVKNNNRGTALETVRDRLLGLGGLNRFIVEYSTFAQASDVVRKTNNCSVRAKAF